MSRSGRIPVILTRIILVKIRSALFSKSWISRVNLPRGRGPDPAADRGGGGERARPGERNLGASRAYIARRLRPEYRIARRVRRRGGAVDRRAFGLAGHRLPFSRTTRAGVGAGAAARDAGLRHGVRLHRLAAVHRAGPDAVASGERLG